MPQSASSHRSDSHIRAGRIHRTPLDSLQAVPFAHEVLIATRGIPFVWHFKEAPFICLEKGTWPLLIDLHQHSDGQIFSSPEMRDWFDTVVPGLSLTQAHACAGWGPAQARLVRSAALAAALRR